VAADDPFVGTWKQNVAKSHSDAPDKSETVVFTAQENGLCLVSDGIAADGKTWHVTYAAKFDGKDYPLMGFTNADTIAIRRIDTNSFSEQIKNAGKEIITARLIVSRDGKTFTRTTEEKSAKGKAIRNTYVFEKK
jgi:hypothetical protein